MSNTKKLLLVVSILIILLTSIFEIWKGTALHSNKIFGSIKSAGDSYVVVSGKYDTGMVDKTRLTDIKVLVSSDTKIIKTSFEKPSAMPKGGVFYPDKIPKKVENVDFSIMKTDFEHVAVGVEVVLKKNFYGGVSMEASEIKYIVPKY